MTVAVNTVLHFFLIILLFFTSKHFGKREYVLWQVNRGVM